MRSPVTRFLTMAVLLAALCAAFMAFWKNSMKEELVLQSGYVMLLVVALTSIGAQLFLLSSANGDAKTFVRKFMGGTVLKFFIYWGVIMGYMMFTTESKKAVVLYFLIAYIPFTLLEVGNLYTQLKKAGKPR
jgi:hypothetical protein